VKKIIEFDDTFPTGELTLQLVLPLRNGRHDLGRVTKSASEALDYIKHVVPEPGKTHLLLLAMGAEETYGPNRNGDGFSEYPVPARSKEAASNNNDRWWIAPGQELTKTYRTFETNPAHAFKHHQNRDPGKASGYVKRAFWNPRMHRVELLTMIDNEKDAEWVERVEAGEFPSVSMGCRIKYDVCSRCGNKAPSRADYCKHAMAMNHINPDGTKNFVYNPDADFFDISRVFRPADRIGYTLKKVAEAASVTLSADLGEAADAAARKTAVARKLSEMDKLIHGTPIAASSLDNNETRLITKFRDFAGKKLAAGPSLPTAELQSAALGPGGLRSVIAAARQAGVVLKDAEFAETAASQMLGRPAQLDPATIDKVAAAASSVLDLFGESSTLLDYVLKDCKLAEASAPSTAIFEAATRIRDKRAYAGDSLYRRLVPEGTGMRPDAPPTTDLLHEGNAMTTRGGAMDARDEVSRAHLRKVLGGSALLLGGYKMLTAYPGLAQTKAPIALGLGALGYKALSPSPGQSIQTDEGLRVPDMAETAPKTASMVSMVECLHATPSPTNIPGVKTGSYHDPVVGLVFDVEHVVDCLGAWIAP